MLRIIQIPFFNQTAPGCLFNVIKKNVQKLKIKISSLFILNHFSIGWDY